MAQQTVVLGGVMLVAEREGVSLCTSDGGQQEQNKYEPPAPTRLSYHAKHHTTHPDRTKVRCDLVYDK